MTVPTSARRAAFDHQRLGSELRRLRDRAGLGTIEAASRAGMSQSKISRLETCKIRPNPDEIDLLCQVYGASRAERDELVQLASSIREVSNRARVVLPRGAARLQDQLARLDKNARLVRSFSPAMVLGNLQTKAYMRHVFATALKGDDLEAAIGVRFRRKSVFNDEGKQFVLIMSEGALRWQMGGPEVMVEQIESIVEESRRANVRIGIIPWTRAVRTFCTHSFDVYDTAAVMVGTEIESVPFVQPADVDQYVQAFAKIEAASSFGDDARRELARIAGEYRLLAQ